jgi:hypothetical protein
MMIMISAIAPPPINISCIPPFACTAPRKCGGRRTNYARSASIQRYQDRRYESISVGSFNDWLFSSSFVTLSTTPSLVKPAMAVSGR